MARCLAHSTGGSTRRVNPTPRGSRPAVAAWTMSGARKASEIIIATLRVLQPSRLAMASGPATAPRVMSASQQRPSAIDRTRVARVAASIGLTVCCVIASGMMMSRARRVEPGDQAMVTLTEETLSSSASSSACSAMSIDCCGDRASSISIEVGESWAPDEMRLDEFAVAQAIGFRASLPQRPDNGCLDLWRRDPGYRSHLLSPTLMQGAGDVVAIRASRLARVGGRHAVAAVIEQLAQQQRL